MLDALADDPAGEAAIDLRGPLLDGGDRAALRSFLGSGEVEARCDVAGIWNVAETAFAGVWWVRHAAADGSTLVERSWSRAPRPSCSPTRPISRRRTATLRGAWMRSIRPRPAAVRHRRTHHGRTHQPIARPTNCGSTASRAAPSRRTQLHRLADGACRPAGRGGDGRRAGPGTAPGRDLAVVPGMHRLHRIADALVQPDAREPDLRFHLARLPPHAAGGLRRGGRSGPARVDGRQQGQVHRRGGRFGARRAPAASTRRSRAVTNLRHPGTRPSSTRRP